MPKLKNNKRVIPFKNYVYLSIILLITFLLLLYFFLWYREYEKETMNQTIISEYTLELKSDGINSYITENPYSYFYVSVVGDPYIRAYEKEFKYLFKSKLREPLIYLNISDVMNNKEKLEELRNVFKLGDKSIVDVPNITIFKNQEVIAIYDIKEDNYNVDKTIEFLKEHRVVE